MPDLSLIDLITPYVLRGAGFGVWHPALAVLAVTQHEVSISGEGVVIRGVVRFMGGVRPYFDPSRMVMGVDADNTEGHPLNDPARRDPWIDIRDSKLEFQLTVPRVASAIINQAVSSIGSDAAFATTAAIFNQYDFIPTDAPPSDYPNTEFTLDFLLTSIVLRPPFLRGAKREPDGILVPDPQNEQVKITLPKIKMRLSQGSAVGDPLTGTLLSAGASGLDDPGDLAVAELITMDPPYAFVGSSNVVGFGFRSAILDLSDGFTPPAILEQFGYDENWKGLYLPEIRLFVAPNGARDLAVDGGVRNLLIGFGQESGGITGDFELQLINQGDGELELSARFYDQTGRGYSITQAEGSEEATVQLPALTRMTIDVQGGRVPITTSAKIGSGSTQPGREHDIDLSSRTEVIIEIQANDTSPTPKNKTLRIRATRQATAALPPAGSQPQPAQNPPVDLRTTSVTQGGVTVSAPRLRLVNETATTATIGLDRSGSATWTVNGSPTGNSATVVVDVAPGASVNVRAELPGAPAVGSFEAFYRFDHPKPSDGVNYATNPANSRTQSAPDEGTNSVWSSGTDSLSALRGVLVNVPNNTNITIKGYASFEGPDTTQSRTYNTALSQRRADGLKAMFEKLVRDSPELAGKNFQFTPAPVADMSNWTSQGTSLATRREWWKAKASWSPSPGAGTITEGVVSRRTVEQPPVPVPIPVVDPEPERPEPPSWFHRLGAKVRIVRNQFVACEVFGRFDYQTAAENRLREGAGPGTSMPDWEGLGSQNPADGLIDIRIVVQIDDATDTVTVTGYFGADPADRDGLALLGTRPNQPPDPGPKNFGLDFFGTSCVFLPLIAEGAGAVANDGAIAQLAISAVGFGACAAIAGLGWIRTERIIWYGGEICVTANAQGEWSTTLLFDIETAISADFLGLIKIARDAPLTVRYKAIGIMFGTPPGQSKFQFRPMFDSSKGYSIDVSKPGAITVADPLGQILQILGARIARNNPMLIEVDLGFSIDLGVISIERARVRARLDSPFSVELTAFGAGIDIPGAIKGRGYLELSETEVKGQIDITIVPVSVRIAAGIGVKQISAAEGGPATGVIVTLYVEFPVAIPLGGSGLGIYGFMGLFAMHYARNEGSIPAGHQAPALAWLKATGGDPTRIDFWEGKVNNWAFGVGAILGTMGSSTIFNLKGMILLELPGPRLLLMMKANLLTMMPSLGGEAEGLLFAVIDLDMGRGTLTIGISAEFKVESLIKLRIPVEAFFNFNDVKDWHLYLGQYKDQIHADILTVFQGSGYLMLSGNGISGITGLPAVTGFSIATGLHVSFIWGRKSINLYAELAAGFDAIVGFDPFRFAGILYVRGKLKLFIISLSVRASLTVDMGEDAAGNEISRISGEICGEVEFLFFTISGCVDFAIGANSVPLPDPPKLGKGLKLISRSPALVVGTGTDRPIDGGIGDGKEGSSAPGDLPVVPIDTIPVVMMSAPPLSDGVKFKGQNLGGTPEAPSGGWVQRGDVFLKYTLKSVELSGTLSEGGTPATWWKPKSGEKAMEAQLALLSWIPEPTPKAIESNKFLEQTITETWGTICKPAAPPTPVFWTFLEENIGTSQFGWNLDGSAWPDPSGTIRNTPTNLKLRVNERWRSGDHKLDQMRSVVPAQVEGRAVICMPDRDPKKPNDTGTTRPNNPGTVITNPGIYTPEIKLNKDLLQKLPVIDSARGIKFVDRVLPKTLDAIELVKEINSGAAVTRAMYQSVTYGNSKTDTAATNNQRNCQSRVLASPVYDDIWLYRHGPRNERQKNILNRLEGRKFKPGPLVNAVSFHTDAVEYATFYMFVSRDVLASGNLLVAVMDKDENMLDAHSVNPADTVSATNVYPARWMDTNGDWLPDLYRLVQHAIHMQELGYIQVLVTIKSGKDADHIQIGLKDIDPDVEKKIGRRAFYVAAIEATRMEEVLRYDYETSEQTKKQGTAGTVLTVDTGDYALLQKNTTYSVTVSWDVYRERRPPGGGVPKDQKNITNQTQTFWFRTDPNPPARLDPWILASTPEDGEKHFFGLGAIQIVFSTNNVLRLYDTYGKRLQVRLKASSYHPPPSTAAVPHPFLLNQMTVQPVAKSVLDPFEETLEKVLDGSCVPTSGSRIRHSRVDIPIPLDLYTDYVLDVEMVDKSAPEGTAGVSIWRRSFSTGAFRTLDTFAESFFIARVKHRAVNTGALQAIANKYASRKPEGSELDTDFINAGLEPPELPDQPRLVVYWETVGGTPQPAAVIVDSSEPLWRSRQLPREVSGETANGNKRYEMVSVPWLQPSEQSGGDNIIDKIIAAPGGQRALISLKPNSRGKKLKLALKKIAQKEPYLDGPGAVDQYVTIADLILNRAPWEEEAE